MKKQKTLFDMKEIEVGDKVMDLENNSEQLEIEDMNEDNTIIGNNQAYTYLKEGVVVDITRNNPSYYYSQPTLEDYKIGVFGKIKNSDYVIKKNDRLELYNPITIDPKIRRKNIAINS